MTRSSRLPTATIKDRLDGEVVWRITYPSTLYVSGPTYIAITDHAGKLLRIETAAKRLLAAAGVVERITPAVETAIDKARTGIVWTDAPNGSAGHVGGQLVIQIRKLVVGGWSAGWRNGMTWDVSDQLTQVKRQASRHFRTRQLAKAAAEQRLRSHHE